MKRLSLIILLAFTAAAQGQLYDGLVNYYSLDGNFDDTAASLAGNTSTFDDLGFQPDESVTFDTRAGFGQFGVFAGDDNSYIEIDDSDDIVFTDRNLSISGWFNVGSLDDSWQAIISKGESSDYRVARRGGSNVTAYAGGVGDIPTDDNTGPNINAQEWNHFVSITEEGVSTRFWVNGELVAESADVASIQDNGSGRLMIGGNPDTGPGFRTWNGGLDDFGMWERVLTGEEIGKIYAAGLEGVALPGANDFVAGPLAIGPRDGVGAREEAAGRENLMFGDPVGPNSPGLLQSWYTVANPGSKDGINNIVAGNEPAVTPFHSADGTWWSGSQSVTDIQQYPVEVDGVITGDNYSVVLTGDILIEESGSIRFLDGVDDYTYLAIDMDRSGTPGDADGEILINDNGWTNALSDGNGGAPIVTAEFTDIAEGGEWLAMEFNMAEGGGGDHGMLYWDFNDEDGVFPEAQGDGVDDLDAFFLQVPDTHLRGPAAPGALESGEWVGAASSSATGWEIDVNPADGTSDQFTLPENPDSDVYTSVMNVDGVELHINPLGDVEDGDSFQVFLADTILGEPVIATDGWSFDAATGSVVFGMGGIDTCGEGDLDGNGMVEFADFLILSGNFGNAVGSCAEGDIDGDGTVAFADFLVLSGNFGTSVGAESVPEPSSALLLGLASLALGCFRRRR